MKNFNKSIEIESYTIGEVNKQVLGSAIYKKMIEDLGEFLKIKDYKLKALDMFTDESFAKDNEPDWLMIQTTSEKMSFQQDEKNVVPDIVADPNNIPIRANEFDLVFTVGNRFGYGNYHSSIFEVERIIKPGGILVVGLSRYWFNKEFNQLLLCYRNWRYIRAVEINYTILDDKIESAKYFAIYRFKG